MPHFSVLILTRDSLSVQPSGQEPKHSLQSSTTDKEQSTEPHSHPDSDKIAVSTDEEVIAGASSSTQQVSGEDDNHNVPMTVQQEREDWVEVQRKRKVSKNETKVSILVLYIDCTLCRVHRQYYCTM